MRRRVRGVGQRLRERESLGASEANAGIGRGNNGVGSAETSDSRSSIRSGVLPPGFDIGQFSAYTQTDEAVSGFFLSVFSFVDLVLHSPFILACFGISTSTRPLRTAGNDAKRSCIIVCFSFLGFLREEAEGLLLWTCLTAQAFPAFPVRRIPVPVTMLEPSLPACRWKTLGEREGRRFP